MALVIFKILLIIVSIAIVVLVMMQEGKNGGLGALTGEKDNTYWGRNKAKSKESVLKKITAVLLVLFVVFSVLMSTSLFG